MPLTIRDLAGGKPLRQRREVVLSVVEVRQLTAPGLALLAKLRAAFTVSQPFCPTAPGFRERASVGGWSTGLLSDSIRELHECGRIRRVPSTDGRNTLACCLIDLGLLDPDADAAELGPASAKIAPAIADAALKAVAAVAPDVVAVVAAALGIENGAPPCAPAMTPREFVAAQRREREVLARAEIERHEREGRARSAIALTARKFVSDPRDPREVESAKRWLRKVRARRDRDRREARRCDRARHARTKAAPFRTQPAPQP